MKCSRLLFAFATLKFLLSHNSMRYRRIFNIIDSFKRFIIELQTKLLFIYFNVWVLKLLNCIAWKLSFDVESFGRQPRRFFYLIYWTLTHHIMFFWKNILGPPCLFISIYTKNIFLIRSKHTLHNFNKLFYYIYSKI